MLHGRYILPGATELKPLMQDQLSGLCGLYSLLNGIQLALYPQLLLKKQLQDLYVHVVDHLSRARQLKRVLGSGMGEDTWLKLGRALVKHVNNVLGSSLVLKPLLTGVALHRRARALHVIRKTIKSGNPVLVVFGGALDHYTVLTGYSDQRLLLFDSASVHWIQTSNVGLGEHSRRRHWLFPKSASALIDDW